MRTAGHDVPLLSRGSTPRPLTSSACIGRSGGVPNTGLDGDEAAREYKKAGEFQEWAERRDPGGVSDMPLDRHGSRETLLSGDLEDHRPVPHLGERPWIAVVAMSGDGPRVKR